MITAEQLERLEKAAEAWVDRPEHRCQFAMAGIYQDAGLLPALEIPDRPRDWARSSAEELIIPFVDSCGYFDRVEGSPEPGDLVGFRLGHTTHHVSIMLSGGRMVHVFGHHGVKIAVCIPPEWAKRLTRIWRLK